MTPARLAARLTDVAAAGTDPEALAAVLGFMVRPRRGPDVLRRIVRDAGSSDVPSVAVARAAGTPSAEVATAAVAVAGAWVAAGVRAALVGDASYPARLAEGWPDLPAPPLLAWRGAAPDDAPAVALVGSRRASGYGTSVAAWLAEAVASAGVRVISGGARGVDATAHEAALGRAGGTSVVLGCGHDVAYPRIHARPAGLFERVLVDGGTLVSEFLPDQPPRPAHVRARNRIVAGLADVVVVVEGAAGSGSLLTATAAAEWGRPVLAVPGDVRAPGSAAPHRLLHEGAAPCTGPGELLEALHAAHGAWDLEAASSDRVGADSHGSRSMALDGQGDATGTFATVLDPPVWAALASAWPRPVRLEGLATATALPPARLLAQLTRARIAGEIADGSDGIRLRRAPATRPSNNHLS